MTDEALLKALTPVWPGIEAYLREELLGVMALLVDAQDNDTVRLLQGRAIAYRSILNLPNTLATIVGETSRS